MQALHVPPISLNTGGGVVLAGSTVPAPGGLRWPDGFLLLFLAPSAGGVWHEGLLHHVQRRPG